MRELADIVVGVLVFALFIATIMWLGNLIESSLH